MSKKTILLSTVFFAITTLSFGQVIKKKHYFPIWTFQQKSINIHGVSIGLWSFNDQARFTNTNGLKVELIGAGILVPLIPKTPTVENESDFNKLKLLPISERINGFSISTTGTTCHCLTNGFTAGLIGQINFQVNGISTSLLMNFVQKQNGLQMAMFNEAYIINGVQVGISNYGVKTKGFQFGVGNFGKDTKGLQIGIFNKSDNLKGLQFGIWNVNQKRKLPLINWNFKKDTT